jgi:putative ABC transport system permease protein
VLKHYCSLAVRNLQRAPVAAAANVLTLALGLVCFVAAYAFAAFWGRADQHFVNADRIAVLTVNLDIPGLVTLRDEPSTPEVAAAYLETDFPALERVARAVVINEHATLASGDRAVRANVVAADPEFLELFDLPFTAGDPRAALAAPGGAVLTQRQAAALFGGADPMGRSILVENAVEATITGVLGPIPEPSHLGRSAAAPLPFDVLVARDVLDRIRAARRNPNAPQPPPENWLGDDAFTYMLLPRDGSMSVGSLRTALAQFAERHVPPELSGFARIGFGALPVGSLLGHAVDGELFFSHRGASVASVLLTLGTLVLGVACVNYANLATARAARRLREVGVRKALGARPAHIMAQHLLETAMLSAAALAVALVVLRLSQPAIDALVGAPVADVVAAGPRFWLFLIAVTTAVTLAAGAYPAFVLAQVRPIVTLRASRARIGPRLLSTLLVGTQFAIASFLLIAVTITTLQNRELLRTGLGADSDPLLIIENVSDVTKIEPATLRAELERLPQITGVTEVGDVPWEVIGGTMVATTPGPDAITKGVLSYAVGYDFFSVLDIPVIAGRVFSPERFATDFPGGERTRASQPRAIVVDRAFVEELGFASPQAAIDQIVYFPESTMSAFGQGAQPLRIIGVAENKPFSFFGPTGAAITMYQLSLGLRFEVARLAAGDVPGALAAVDEMWQRLAPNVAIRRRFLDDVFDDRYATFAGVSDVFTGLAALAFVICVTGLFGMATLVTSRRLPEIGVRKTLGASTVRIVAMLLTSFGKPVVIANLLVWPLAYLAARSYLDLLLSPIELDPLPFVMSLVVTAAIAALAVGGQTLRAARSRPADVLRDE